MLLLKKFLNARLLKKKKKSLQAYLMNRMNMSLWVIAFKKKFMITSYSLSTIVSYNSRCSKLSFQCHVNVKLKWLKMVKKLLIWLYRISIKNLKFSTIWFSSISKCQSWTVTSHVKKLTSYLTKINFSNTINPSLLKLNL
jgi:hypothetical protein